MGLLSPSMDHLNGKTFYLVAYVGSVYLCTSYTFINGQIFVKISNLGSTLPKTAPSNSSPPGINAGSYTTTSTLNTYTILAKGDNTPISAKMSSDGKTLNVNSSTPYNATSDWSSIKPTAPLLSPSPPSSGWWLPWWAWVLIVLFVFVIIFLLIKR